MSIRIKMTRQNIQLSPTIPMDKFALKELLKNKKFIGVKMNYYENGNLKEVDSILNPCTLNFCCCDGKVL